MKGLPKILIIIFIITPVVTCFSQHQKKLQFNLEGAYQFWEYQTIIGGIGLKVHHPLKNKVIDYYDFHVSTYYEAFLKPFDLKYNFSWSSGGDYQFKYFSVGFFGRAFNGLNKEYAFEISPQIGIGYKYIWLIYSRSLTIYDKQHISMLINNIRLVVNIPVFTLKL